MSSNGVIGGVYQTTHKMLGTGSYAMVVMGKNVVTEEAVAIKIVSLDKLRRATKQNDKLLAEIGCLRKLNHPNIVRLLASEQSDRHFYLVLEFCPGGDLTRVIERAREMGSLISEVDARRVVNQLANGLKAMRSLEMIHRDIKPANLLLTTPDLATATVKIADFGFARSIQAESLADTVCGTPLYMAPEVFRHVQYDGRADLWSVGAVLFELVCGSPPFTGISALDLMRNIEKGEYLSTLRAVNVSAACVHLVERLLQRDPQQRINYDEFFSHPWLRGATEMISRVRSLPLLSPLASPRTPTQSEILRQQSDGGAMLHSQNIARSSVAESALETLQAPRTNPFKRSTVRTPEASPQIHSQPSPTHTAPAGANMPPLSSSSLFHAGHQLQQQQQQPVLNVAPHNAHPHHTPSAPANNTMNGGSSMPISALVLSPLSHTVDDQMSPGRLSSAVARAAAAKAIVAANVAQEAVDAGLGQAAMGMLPVGRISPVQLPPEWSRGSDLASSSSSKGSFVLVAPVRIDLDASMERPSRTPSIVTSTPAIAPENPSKIDPISSKKQADALQRIEDVLACVKTVSDMARSKQHERQSLRLVLTMYTWMMTHVHQLILSIEAIESTHDAASQQIAQTRTALIRLLQEYVTEATEMQTQLSLSLALSLQQLPAEIDWVPTIEEVLWDRAIASGCDAVITERFGAGPESASAGYEHGLELLLAISLTPLPISDATILQSYVRLFESRIVACEGDLREISSSLLARCHRMMTSFSALSTSRSRSSPSPSSSSPL